MADLVERTRIAARILREIGGQSAMAEAVEAAREDAERMKRDIAELYDVIPMLPITAETMDAATDWFTRYCIDFHREINTAIDQARGKGVAG